MAKKFLTAVLAVLAIGLTFSACKKEKKEDGDLTRKYFPLTFGKYVTYDVDSIYYNEILCTQYRVKSQLKYVVSDTFTDRSTYFNREHYIVDVYSRPYDGAVWKPQAVFFVNPTANGLNWIQDNVKYTKLRFPVVEGFSWKGNEQSPNDPEFFYLKDWNYQYRDYGKAYNTGKVNFGNTVTVLEQDENVNYPGVDSGVAAYRTFSKAVYAYNIGMVYREITHWTYKPNNSKCVNGYSVVMRAVDHN